MRRTSTAMTWTTWMTGMTAALALAALAACQRPSEATDPAASAAAPAAEEKETVTGGEAFHGLLPYRAKDAKLALIRPTFITAAEAGLAAGVSVLGVTVGDHHRAYPLYVLKNHQVVNDRLGGVPIAASW